MEAIVIICAVIVSFLVFKLVIWFEDRKLQKEKPERYPHPKEDVELKTSTDKPMPHVDLEATKELALEGGKKMEEAKETRDLFLETLTKMGCQYEVDDEDHHITFKWQGGNFTADAKNGNPFVLVWYLYWDEYELYDIDTLSRVKRIINDANINYNINVVYSVDKAGCTFHVHSKKHFLFISQIPSIDEYLQSLLGQFFNVRHYIESELLKLKNEEEKVAQ